MDYGQLAYLKTQELESYVRRSAVDSGKRTAQSAAFYPHTAISGGYEPCTVYGDGCVALAAVLTLRAPEGFAGKVRLYCGGKIAAYTQVTLSAGESGRYTLLASVYPADGERLRICAERDGVLLDELHVLVEGSGAAVTSGQEGYKSDCYNGEIYLVREHDGNVEVSRASDGKKAIAVHGGVYDLAASAIGICVACADDNGNLWGLTYTADLDETSRTYLGPAPDRIAVGRSITGLTLAAVRSRKVYFATADAGFAGLSDWTAADFVTEADDVYLSKQADNPVLFLRRDGEIFAKIPLPAYSTDGCIEVSPMLALL